MGERIGIFGGTFNPIHRGHIEAGRKISEFFGLAKILYILSAQPPHKQKTRLVSTEKRWKMLTAALKPYSNLEACDLEIRRPDLSWTIDTIIELKKIHPADLLFFISGSEGFLKIQSWKNFRDILNMIPFIIIIRRPEDIPQIEKLLASEKMVVRDVSEEPLLPCAYLFSYQSDLLNISSTLIRERISRKQPVRQWVDANVLNIMEVKNPYDD